MVKSNLFNNKTDLSAYFCGFDFSSDSYDGDSTATIENKTLI